MQLQLCQVEHPDSNFKCQDGLGLTISLPSQDLTWRSAAKLFSDNMLSRSPEAERRMKELYCDIMEASQGVQLFSDDVKKLDERILELDTQIAELQAKSTIHSQEEVHVDSLSRMARVRAHKVWRKGIFEI